MARKERYNVAVYPEVWKQFKEQAGEGNASAVLGKLLKLYLSDPLIINNQEVNLVKEITEIKQRLAALERGLVPSTTGVKDEIIEPMEALNKPVVPEKEVAAKPATEKDDVGVVAEEEVELPPVVVAEDKKQLNNDVNEARAEVEVVGVVAESTPAELEEAPVDEVEAEPVDEKPAEVEVESPIVVETEKAAEAELTEEKILAKEAAKKPSDQYLEENVLKALEQVKLKHEKMGMRKTCEAAAPLLNEWKILDKSGNVGKWSWSKVRGVVYAIRDRNPSIIDDYIDSK